jgi:hypothetical protein
VRPRNIALAAAGLALFEASRIGARTRTLHPAEVRVFRTANEAADELGPPVRAVMQLGTFGAVPALAAVLVALGRRRTAAEILVSGTAAWVLAKKAKPLAGRPRPAPRPRIGPDARIDRWGPRVGFRSRNRLDDACPDARARGPRMGASPTGRRRCDYGLRADVRRCSPAARSPRRRGTRHDDRERRSGSPVMPRRTVRCRRRASPVSAPAIQARSGSR